MKTKAYWLLPILCLFSDFLMSQSLPVVNPAQQLTPRFPSSHIPVANQYGKLPMSFEANSGQTDPQVKFLSRGQGYTLFLTSREAVLTLAQPVERSAGKATLLKMSSERLQPASTAVMHMQLVGANPAAKVEAQDELPGRTNYFIGNDPKKWRTDVANYARVRYREVYPGIDLVYYGNQRQLEHDFVVAPGADPSRIRLRLRGVLNLRVANNGDLLMRAREGELRLLKPKIYQEADGARWPVEGRYAVRKNNIISFAVANYDSARPLVIDPVLSYSTYLGGSNAENGRGIAVDASGNAYVTGVTDSTDFPPPMPCRPATAAGLTRL